METFAGGRVFTNAPPLSTPVLPIAVAVSPDGTVWTTGRSHLMQYDPFSNTVSERFAEYGDSWMDSGVFDVAGNLYLVEYQAVYRLNPVTGQKDLVAGNGSWGDSGDWGPATSASLRNPGYLAFDGAGNLYIPDAGSNRVRVVDTNGYIRPFAGNGQHDSTGDGGPAQYASLSNPTAVAVDADGNVYIAEQDGDRIRKVAADTGIISTIAGLGDWDATDDGIPALQANLWDPTKLALDGAGHLLVDEMGRSRIRSIDLASGIITTLAGNGNSEYGGDGGPATAASWTYAPDFALDSAGNLFIGDYGDRRLRRVDAGTGVITTVLGNGTQGFCGHVTPRLESCLQYPGGLAIAANGDVYVADSANGLVRRITRSDDLLTTYAGNGTIYSHSGDGGPATSASFGDQPDKLGIDPAGNLFIASLNDHRVRRVDASTGIITTFAGVGVGGFSGDGGPATAAKLNRPFEVISDAAGNVYISDTANNRIRRVDAATGTITTFAGNGVATGPLGDGGPAVAASLSSPSGLAFDAAGNLLLSDSGHFRIRRIDAVSGVITTLAGNGGVMPSGDGGPALAAAINSPDAIALDAAGNIFFSTTYGIRRIDAASGIISLAVWESLQSVRFDSSGDLFASDSNNNRIVRIAGLGAQPDTTPPVITANVAGASGNGGWYRGDVQITWTVTDPESAIGTRNGCTASSVISDTAGVSFTCTASSSGGSASKTVTVKRDSTAPSLAFGALSPAPDASGWNSGDVTIPFTADDALSGVQSTDTASPLVVTGSGNALGVPVVVTDVAGNSATYRSPPVRIDRTPPTIVPTISGPLGDAGWYRGDVQLTWSAPDAESPLRGFDCPAQTVTSDTSGVTFSCTATSAGGTAAGSVTIKRDATPPTLQWGAFSPLPNASGWNKTNVTVPFTNADALSGVASVSTASPLTLSTEGAGVTGQVTVTDNAGNSQTFVTDPRNIDKTAPVVAIVAPANGATYGFYQDVVANYSCTDVSLLSCTGTTANGALVNTKTAGARTFKVTAKDQVAFTSSVTNAFTVESAFNFDGFLPGVVAPPALNLVPKGSLVPVRWRLPDGHGGFVTNTASYSSATVTSYSCSGAVVPLNDPAVGSAGIGFDPATNVFTYNWQTGSSWTGCRKLVIKLKDGSLHELVFKFQ